jgi:hypothetical protein
MVDATMVRRPSAPASCLPGSRGDKQRSANTDWSNLGQVSQPAAESCQSDLAVPGPVSPRLHGKMINGDPTAKKTSRLADQISLSFAYLYLVLTETRLSRQPAKRRISLFDGALLKLKFADGPKGEDFNSRLKFASWNLQAFTSAKL